MTEAKPSELNQLRFMAIALITEGIGTLDPQTAEDLDKFQEEGRPWREHLIFRLNGYDMPPLIIIGAIRKRWQENPAQNVEQFTREILAEWNLLDE